MIQLRNLLLTCIFLFSFSGFGQEADEVKRMDTDAGPLVEVSSVLWDMGLAKAVRVSGVGTLIRSLRRPPQNEYIFYVLTAGHVAFGSDLQVRTPDHRNLRIKRAYHDTENDVSILELDTNQQIRTPLVALAQQMDSLQAVLFSAADNVSTPELRQTQAEFGGFFTRLNELGWSPQLQDYVVRTKGSRFEVAIVLLDLGRPESAGEGRPGQYPSVAVRAPWLSAEGLKMPRNPQLVSRKLTEKTLEISYRFPRGYSGSPILVGHGGGSFGNLYILSSILTTTSSIENSTQTSSVGPRALQQFLEKIQAGRANEETLPAPAWCFVNNTFVKIQRQIEFFVESGPIGNGVVIDGYSPTTKVSLEAKKRLQESLHRNGMTRDEMIQFEKQAQAANQAAADTLKSISTSERKASFEKQFQELNLRGPIQIR